MAEQINIKSQLRRFFMRPLNRVTIGVIFTGFCSQFVLIISGILVARILGVEGRGYLALLVVFPTIIIQLGSMGLPRATTYFIAGNPDRISGITKRILRLFPAQCFILVAFHVVVLFIYLDGQSWSVHLAGFVTLGVIPGGLARQYGLAILQAQQRFRLYNLFAVLIPTLYAVPVLGIYIFNIGKLPAVAVVWMLSNIFSGVLVLYLSTHNIPISLTVGKEIPTIREMLSFALKGLFGAVAPIEAFRIDHLVAGILLPPSALGLYVVAQAFTNLPSLIAQNAGIVVYPAAAGQQKTSPATALVWRFFWAVTLLTLIVAMLLIIMVPVLLPFFFGHEFSSAVPIAQILLIGAVFMSSRRILVEGLRGMGLPQISTFAELSMYPWLLTGGLYFVLRFGVKGLAAGVVIGYAISLLVAIKIGVSVTRKTEKTVLSVTDTQRDKDCGNASDDGVTSAEASTTN